MGHRECLKDLAEGFWLVMPAGLIGMAGSVVRYLRRHRHERFSWGAFISGMVTAFFAGVLAYLVFRGMGLNQFLTSGLVAMVGYCGGNVLDLSQEVLFEWIRTRGRK